MKYYILLLISAILILSSCNNKQAIISDKSGNSIQTGVVETVTVPERPSLNYCYFLPNSYNGNDSLPVVFILDPHANGKLPAEKYHEIANKYGYILIASNAIKNGQPSHESLAIFWELIKETKAKFIVDENRLFVAGFSGGAKVAIVFAQQIPEIIGVAACGGSLPIPPSHVPNYYYAGIVGNEDFNYLETNQTFAIFDQQGLDYTSIIFDGGHVWPPAKSFEMSLIGFDIYAMKLKRIVKNEEWLENIHSRMIDSINHFEKAGKIIDENIYIRQTARWFYGLKNTKDLNLKAGTIERSSEFVTQIKKRQKLIQTEVKLRAEFIRAIELRELDWWNQEIEKINNSIKQADKDVAQVSHRLLNYISMASFMLTKTDLNDAKLDNAAKKIKIYELVDPENPDVYLMYARYYMQMENFAAMNESFKKARALGFTDINTYKAESFWKPLFTNKLLDI